MRDMRSIYIHFKFYNDFEHCTILRISCYLWTANFTNVGTWSTSFDFKKLFKIKELNIQTDVQTKESYKFQKHNRSSGGNNKQEMLRDNKQKLSIQLCMDQNRHYNDTGWVRNHLYFALNEKILWHAKIKIWW